MNKLKEFMIKRFFKWIVSFFCGASAFAQSPESMNILFIGNSYTHMNSMPFLFDKIAKAKGKSVNVEMNTHSGFSFKEHTGREDMFEAIKSKKWDYVVLQGFSREFIHPVEYLDTATMPYLTQIIDSIKSNNSCTQMLFYMTWGYKYGYKYDETVGDYNSMSDTIEKGYHYVSDHFKIPIVPVGRVWKSVVENHKEINLYDSDLAHPSKQGSYLSASTFFASIFRESPEGAIIKNNIISEEDAKIIHRAAASYVLPNLSKYHLDVNIWDVSYQRTEMGSFEASFYASYPFANSIKWDLGDGTKSEEPILKYIYKKAGNYRVKLTVEDTCGVRNYFRDIYFEPLKEPAPVPDIKPKTKVRVKKRI